MNEKEKLKNWREQPTFKYVEDCKIADDLMVGEDVFVYPGGCIGSGVIIKDKTRIGPNVIIGSNVTIGESCDIWYESSIGDGIIIPDKSIIRPRQTFNTQENLDLYLMIQKLKNWKVQFMFKYGEGCKIAPDLMVGENVRLKERIVIEDDVKIGEWSFIEKDVKIGKSCFLWEWVTIGRGSIIGSNVTIKNDIQVPPKSIIEANKTFNTQEEVYNYLTKPLKNWRKETTFKHGQDCEISDDLMVGKKVKIGNFSTIRYSTLIQDDVKIGKDSFIDINIEIGKGTIIEDNVTIYKNSTIGYLVKIKKGSVISDGVTIGDEIIIPAGAKIEPNRTFKTQEELDKYYKAKLRINILTIDIGNKSGWAVFNKEAKILHGSYEIKKQPKIALHKKHQHQDYISHYIWYKHIENLIETHKPNKIFYEELILIPPKPNVKVFAGNNLKTYASLYAKKSILLALCCKYDILAEGIPIKEIKSFVSSQFIGNYTIVKNKIKVSKQNILGFVAQKGYEVKTDDEADALAMLLYVLSLNKK